MAPSRLHAPASGGAPLALLTLATKILPFAPGSHHAPWHRDDGNPPDAKQIWRFKALLSNTEWGVPLVADTGGMYLYDSRLMHRGGGYRDPSGPPRELFYFSVLRSRGAKGAGASLCPPLSPWCAP